MAHAHDLATILATLDDAALIKGRTFKRLVRTLMRTIPKPGKGLKGREEVDGIALDADSLGLSIGFDHPFYPTVIDDELYIEPGSLNGTVCEMESGPMDRQPRPSFVLPSSGIRRVYLEINTILDFLDDYLIGYSVPTGEVKLGSSVPSSNPETGVFYVHLATVEHRVVTARLVRTSLFASICDGGESTATLSLTIS